MDVGATVLDLVGAGSAARTTDGVSLVPLLHSGGGAAPSGWRSGVLVEHLGELNQWMNVWCVVVARFCGARCGQHALSPLDFSFSGTIYNVAGCPLAPATDPFYLIDGPQNTWSAWRVVNETHDFLLAEFRPQGTDPTHKNSNHTEFYDLVADPWQSTNAAGTADIAAARAELWAVADCALDTCP